MDREVGAEALSLELAFGTEFPVRQSLGGVPTRQKTARQ